VTDGSRRAVAGPIGDSARSSGGRREPGSLPTMADTSTQSIQVHAPVDRVAAVISDFARYPEWVEAAKQVEVVEEYEDGYAAQVRFVIEAGVMDDEYTLEYAYADDLSRIEWHLVAPSKTQKSQRGSYDLADNGDGCTTVTYTLEVELAIAVLGMFRRKAEKLIMDTALKQLKRRVESLATA
jgi:ribosome-associated toxin RatA of RatAB toxin-antitoxin module